MEALSKQHAELTLPYSEHAVYQNYSRVAGSPALRYAYSYGFRLSMKIFIMTEYGKCTIFNIKAL